jgi:flagellar biosynthesis protein FlhG
MLGGVSDSFRELESDVEEESGDFDGAKLRRARLRRGFELDQIADITKVNIRILRQLEEENFEDLPATVYVRGFLSAYARTIGLDPARVVSSYVPRVETARSSQSRSGFRGRR